MTGDPAYLDIASAGEQLRSRALSPVELTEAVLARIEALEPSVSAYALTLPERALAEARAAERELATGHVRGPLHGIPVGGEGSLRHRWDPDRRRLAGLCGPGAGGGRRLRGEAA